MRRRRGKNAGKFGPRGSARSGGKGRPGGVRERAGGRGSPGRIPALLVRHGRYTVAEPIFVEETRTVSVAKKSRQGAGEGDLVILSTREHDRALTGEVVRVIGSADHPPNVYEALFASIHTGREFREKVEAEAEEVADRPFDASGERRDLRDLPTVTVDGADAKDFDDAISVEQRPGGGYRLHVHIADVTHYVKPGGPLDKQAAWRANSVYLPGTVAPMLPERLSNGVCSLRPNEDRAAVTAAMELSESGEVLSSEVYRSTIRSDARLTYDAVDRFITGEGEVPQAELVGAAYRLSVKLKERARERGKLELGGREPEYRVGEDGVPVGVTSRRSTEARDLIEELMVLTNEVVAKRLEARSLGGVFRVHERPDEEAMEELQVRLAALGLQVEPEPETLGEIVASSDSDAVRYMVLRSLPRAHYSPEPNGHFGLALEDYTHFTSPIRRYSDVLVHRALLGEEQPEDLGEIAEHISERERKSMIAERTADDYTLMWLMRDRVGETFEGTVVGTASFGLFVELDETGATGMVHASKFEGWWELEASGVVFANEATGEAFRIGDRLLVELEEISPILRRAELSIVKRIEEGKEQISG
ncbi:VacB and RNase II family 3'-5' exoribonuclease [Rubrobacter radiotolerans]|uniref:exoribonuclease II n=1 Tax=Rubrobacter radiotolerans TaxID=42256 RepID=A0A023X453_RUBRA|nr:VacB/RNase II family 3'-5' exoribonuclease [Rubrobacter radiotolerans]AHY46839.1 VacB and RNase II family 3'-5' exoribonuclease [Rubrobacter radiotolerans]MDX5894245.1 VacB/RNase II family 3'-5' exoribonuclease [Rubrobacter radiotolerans]SMC05554.1 RNAse R [Rubrobacter radiotolerans DSM 5868]